MPKTERKDTLKIYGEAELTVSEPEDTVAVSISVGFGKNSNGDWFVVKVNVLIPTTSLTVNEPL